MALGAVIKVNASIKFKKQRHQQVSFEIELWGILVKTGHSLFNQVLKCLSFQ